MAGLSGDRFLRFPADLGTDQQQGHFMNFDIFPSGGGGQTTISMFMPTGGQNGSFTWETEHDYDEVKLTKLGLGMVGAFAPAAETFAKAGIGAARLAGKGTINPKVDVLYSNTRLRTFDFQFFMSPSSPTEGQAMKEIIDTFRVSSAPGLSAAPGSIPDIGQQVQQGLADLGLNSLAAGQLQTGFWFTPPAEFQISFYSYYNGAAVENINFPKIARCVLTNVDMNYSQQNEMSLFRDGAPTNVQLSLRFREMRVITREDIALGY